MSEQAASGHQPFSNEYPIPNDQVNFGIKLTEDFDSRYSQSKGLMRDAIEEVQRFAGIGVPKYQLDPAGLAENDMDIVDENGNLKMERNHMATLRLTSPPVPYEERNGPRSEEFEEWYHRTSDGAFVVGDMPPEAHDIMEGVYSLIGAQVILDDREAGEPRGEVLRRGDYLGSPIYIAELYDDIPTRHPDSPTKRFMLFDEKHAINSMNELRPQQLREVAQELGLDLFGARNFAESHGMKPDNYKGVVGVLKSAKEAVNNAVSEGESVKEVGVSDEQIAQMANMNPESLGRHGLTSKNLSHNSKQIIIGETEPIREEGGMDVLGVVAVGRHGAGFKIMAPKAWKSRGAKNLLLSPLKVDDKENANMAGSHTPIILVNADGKPVELGRQQVGADRLGLNEATVSRAQCSVRVFENGVIVVTDNNSAHGTRVVTKQLTRQ